MYNSKRFFKCSICGNIISMIEDKGTRVVCCGKPMDELVANTSEGAGEKHIPEVTIDGNKVRVQVGSVMHPMLPEHHIGWICVVTTQGIQRKALELNSDPVAEFAIAEGDKVLAVYEYCNLHGLWKVEL